MERNEKCQFIKGQTRNNNFTYDEMKTIGAAIRQVKENRKLMKTAADKGELIELEIK